MRYQNFFLKHLILIAFHILTKNPFRKLSFFLFRYIKLRFWKILLKIISQRVLVKLQTDTVFTQSLSNSYDESLISSIFFPWHHSTPRSSRSRLLCRKQSLKMSRKVEENTCAGLSILMQFQALCVLPVEKGLQQRFFW